MKIINEEQLDFDDVMLRPGNSELDSRKDVNIHVTLPALHCKYTLNGFPLLNANMGPFSFEFVKAMLKEDCFGVLHKWEDPKEVEEFLFNIFKMDLKYKTHLLDRLFFTAGTRKQDLTNINTAVKNAQKKGVKLRTINIRLDSPNGHNTQFIDALKRIRDFYGDTTYIVAGNVVTAEKTKEILENGADLVSIGIGSGNQCSTRVQAASGRPQFSAIVDCAQAAREMKAGIVSDGGIKTPGDAAKAFGAGAHAVMVGSMLGGADETIEPVIETLRSKAKKFYGSASKTAHDNFYGESDMSYKTFEGITSYLPYSGPVKNTIDSIKGGIRSAGTFIGAKDLYEFYDKAVFYKVRHQISRIK